MERLGKFGRRAGRALVSWPPGHWLGGARGGAVVLAAGAGALRGFGSLVFRKGQSEPGGVGKNPQKIGNRGEIEDENKTCGFAKHVFKMRKNRYSREVSEIGNHRAVIQNAGLRGVNF